MSNPLFLEKLHSLKSKYEDIGQALTDPDIMSDMKRYVRLNKDYKDLQPIIEAFEEYKNILSNIDDAKNLLAKE